MSERTYVIDPRSHASGGGWKLTLLDGGEEAGGGVFPVPDEPAEVGMDWWNGIPTEQRGYWLTRSVSAIPADARHAYLLAEAYNDAQMEGEGWVGDV